MSVYQSATADNSPTAWTAEIRCQARAAVEIAAAKHRASGHALRYYLRSAIAHGLAVDEVAEIARLTPAAVLELTDPAVA